MKFALGKGIEKTEDQQKYPFQRVLIIGGSILTLLVVTVIVALRFQQAGSNKSKDELAGNIEIKRDACKLFNLGDAKKLLGKSATAPSNNANAVSSRATVSTCSYSSGAENIDELIALTILVRSSNTIQARQAFEVARKPNAKTIKQIGDQAYYSPETSQLSILKNENWIIIASTKGKTGKGSVDIPKQVAQVILDRL